MLKQIQTETRLSATKIPLVTTRRTASIFLVILTSVGGLVSAIGQTLEPVPSTSCPSGWKKGDKCIPDIGPLRTKQEDGFETIEGTIPSDNPFSKSKFELGKMLFYDPRLSANNDYSCAKCHDPRGGFTDSNTSGRSLGHGGTIGLRNSSTLYDAAEESEKAWDGRAKTLEDQAEGPILGTEMGKGVKALLVKLRYIPDYPSRFDEVSRVDPGFKNEWKGILKAIATFERTIIATDSPFDRYVSNGRKLKDANGNLLVEEFGASEEAGYTLFKGKARCILCHNGSNFTDNQFYNIGVPEWPDNKPSKQYPGKCWGQKFDRDPGRFCATGENKDKGKFKTPTLRNIAETAPYMHNGRFGCNVAFPEFEIEPKEACHTVKDPLKQVVSWHADTLMKPQKLNQKEKDDLIAFLRALSSKPLSQDIIGSPKLPCHPHPDQLRDTEFSRDVLERLLGNLAISPIPIDECPAR